MSDNQNVLSMKCPNCGGTVFFTSSKIATHCSFCGSALPDLKDYVVESAKLNIEQKRHAMQIETIDKETKKQRIMSSAKLIPMIIVGTLAFIYFLIIIVGLSTTFGD